MSEERMWMPSFAPLTQDSTGDLENAVTKGKNKLVIRKKWKKIV